MEPNLEPNHTKLMPKREKNDVQKSHDFCIDFFPFFEGPGPQKLSSRLGETLIFVKSTFSEKVRKITIFGTPKLMIFAFLVHFLVAKINYTGVGNCM